MKMVHCPKCDFEQPDDQYCANCGVNMNSFSPPPLSKFNKILKNWLGQVAVLIVIILGLIIYDKFNGPTKAHNKKFFVQSYYKQTSQKDGEPIPTEGFADTEEPPPEIEKPAPQNLVKINPKVKIEKLAEQPTIKRISVSFFEISQQQLIEIVKKSKEHSSEGESTLGVIEKVVFDNIVKQEPITEKDLKSLKTSETRKIFIGQRDKDTQNPIGIFYDFTRLNPEKESLLSLEIKSYFNFQTENEDLTSLFKGDLTMGSNSVSYISGLTPKNIPISKAEKKIIDSSQILEKFFSPSIIEGGNEIILVIEARR